MTEERAFDGLQYGIINRILKAFSFQPSTLHAALANLMRSHILKGKYRVEIPILISIILSPYAKLHEFAMKAISVLSDPNYPDHILYDNQFENHIKLLIELTLSKKKSYEFRNLALQALSNLSLKDTLKSTIMFNKGLEGLLYHFRNSENVEGQRIAAKALLNLSSGNSKLAYSR